MTRQRCLGGGWYPATGEETVRLLDSWRETCAQEHAFRAGIVPHAGWAFSGKLAFRVFAELDPEPETVIVVGGHIPLHGSLYVAPEDAYETPLGELGADRVLLAELRKRVDFLPDRTPDNSVEVQLPLVKYLYPAAMALYVRVPPSEPAIELGTELRDAADRVGRTVAVVGSTDLTHYGPDYGLTPHGMAEEAHRWVRAENDRGFIDACISCDAHGAVNHALSHHSACSPGAAATAISFAAASGCRNGTLVDYYTSYDVHPDSSFVGYAGLGFETVEP